MGAVTSSDVDRLIAVLEHLTLEIQILNDRLATLGKRRRPAKVPHV